MLTIHGFTQIAPCMPRRFWRECDIFPPCITARGLYIAESTERRWAANHPENAAYASKVCMEGEIGTISNVRFITTNIIGTKEDITWKT